MKKLLPLLLALACATGCIDSFLGPAPAQDYGALFDDVWKEVDLHYSFFNLKNINWDSLRARYRPQALAAPSDPMFAMVLGRMLGELHDVHVSITPGSAGSTMRYLSPWDTIPTFFDSTLVFRRYVPQSRYTTGRHMRYGMLTPTIGYVRIRGFDGRLWASEMDEALDSLRGATHLVIDIRNNPGGNNELAISIAGRFADQERTYGYVRLRDGPNHGDFTSEITETVTPLGRAFSGQVFVLTNRKNFSSAEDFVLAMRALPGVRIIGDTTAGASGGPIVRQLPNGWTYQLSEWMELTRTHHLFEGIGLPPDVVVKATAANARDGIDMVLARAVALAGG